MKKIFKIFLAFAMVFSTIKIQDVEAEEYTVTLNNFNMKNYQEVYEITAGTQLPVEYEIESNIPEEYYPDYDIDILFKQDDGSVGVLGVIDNVLFTFEEERYMYEKLDFLVIRLWYGYSTEEEYISNCKYYSPYSYEEVLEYAQHGLNPEEFENLLYRFNESNFNQQDITPFTVKFTNYLKVNNPDITSIKVNQNGNDIEAIFTTSEIKKGDYTSFDMYFELNMLIDEGDYSYNETFEIGMGVNSIEYMGLIDNKPTYKAIGELLNTYVGKPYGDYKLVRINTYDVASQWKEFNSDSIEGLSNQKIAYDESVDILSQLTDDNIFCLEETIRAREDIYAWPQLRAVIDGLNIDLNAYEIYDEDGNYLEHALDGLNIDTTKPQKITRKITCRYQAGFRENNTVTVDYVLNIIDENGLGTVVDFEKDFEICVKREDVINEDGIFDVFNYPFKVPVKLNDGTYSETIVEFGMGNQVLIQDENCPYGWVSAKFCVPNEYNPSEINLVYRVYMQDDNGNLVDEDGNIIVKYENRKDIVHESNNNAVSVTSLEGSVPTYTTVNAAEADVDDVFDGESIAYDITLNAANNAIQPVDNVEVSIDLPENLKDKEVEVYYVDDEGNTELLESTSNGESVTFNTDHFSTYAVVEKKADDTTTPDDGNDDTTEPNNPTDDTNKEDNTLPEDTNKDDKLEDTTDKEETTKPEDNKEDKVEETNKPTESKPNTPQTGDNSNVGFYTSLLFISMLILSFAFYNKKKEA